MQRGRDDGAPTEAVLVLRVWAQGAGPDALVGRCLVADDSDAPPDSLGVAAGKQALLELVGSWLSGLTEALEAGGDEPTVR